jgi:DNA-binding CsgD family transcriptional regulator
MLWVSRRNPPQSGHILRLMSYYDDTGLTPYQRDQLIVALRRRGYTFRQIAPRVGMSPGGVLKALRRIGEGRLGRA